MSTGRLMGGRLEPELVKRQPSFSSAWGEGCFELCGLDNVHVLSVFRLCLGPPCPQNGLVLRWWPVRPLVFTSRTPRRPSCLLRVGLARMTLGPRREHRLGWRMPPLYSNSPKSTQLMTRTDPNPCLIQSTNATNYLNFFLSG